MKTTRDLFDLSGKVAVITGGAGLLGRKHAEALMEFGANCVIADVSLEQAQRVAEELSDRYEGTAIADNCNITDPKAVRDLLEKILSQYGCIDILINNAANNPKFEDINSKADLTKRFETFPVESWQADIDVSLKGAFLCSQVFGTYMADHRGGVILNIASDLGVIAPDQRIYRKEGSPEEEQPTKPVTYSVAKTGLIGLTRYIATYWADKNIRCNALVPGGVYTGQDEGFYKKLTNLIPMGRMANPDEYKAAVVFLCSEASAYMTGASLIMEGGRTCW